MKNQVLNVVMAGVFVFGMATFVGCGNNSHHHENGEHHEHMEEAYACPMKCEGDKTYDEAGKCPVCEMDMEKVEKNS